LGYFLVNLKMKNLIQKEIWDNIAPEWNEFRTKKDELVEDFLKKQKGKIIDLGCGSGRYLMKLKNSKMYLVDFSEEMINLAKKKKIKAEFFVADMTNLPFEDNFFDSAICISSLHCVETARKREKVVKELSRVLKLGGKCLVGVWDINSKRFKNSLKEKLIGWKDKGQRYYYLYDEKEVHNLFKKCKFKILNYEIKGMMIYFVAEKK
jgi:ubiquinone/menaquinone biosynthesis C-methylase UbiE